jgi:hypothetical protein
MEARMNAAAYRRQIGFEKAIEAMLYKKAMKLTQKLAKKF